MPNAKGRPARKAFTNYKGMFEMNKQQKLNAAKVAKRAIPEFSVEAFCERSAMTASPDHSDHMEGY